MPLKHTSESDWIYEHVIHNILFPEGGNFEVQKMNTAIAGLKTGGVKSITERLGGSEYRHFHRGGSDHVNV